MRPSSEVSGEPVPGHGAVLRPADQCSSLHGHTRGSCTTPTKLHSPVGNLRCVHCTEREEVKQTKPIYAISPLSVSQPGKLTSLSAFIR